MSANYVVLGAKGMLGRACSALLERRELEHYAFARNDIDITVDEQLARIPNGTRVVFNCAAYTDVDGAESDPVTANCINGTAVGALADHCARIDATLVHYSTDYVFAGRSSTPYPVDAPTSPINAYGASKLLGETLLRQSSARALLIRTSWVYAPWGRNFVLTMKNLMSSKPQLRVVDDQRGRPSSAENLAENSLRLIGLGAVGTFHLSDAGECSWYEFACEIKRLLGVSTTITPCPSSEYPRPAGRPSYSVLDIGESERLLGPLSPWPVALGQVLTRGQDRRG